MGTSAIFGTSHEMSRHAIHVAEVLDATIGTVKEMQQRQTAIHRILVSTLGETYKEQAQDYVQFQISLLKNLKLRSDSNQARLKNEIDLVSRCRYLMCHNDSQITPEFAAIPGTDSRGIDLQ
jgi:hypothetical protein